MLTNYFEVRRLLVPNFQESLTPKSSFSLYDLWDQIHHFLRVMSSSHLKTKVGHILVKTVSLRINLNIDGTPIVSTSHTHPSKISDL
jgi:hypothetical protein